MPNINLKQKLVSLALHTFWFLLLWGLQGSFFQYWQTFDWELNLNSQTCNSHFEAGMITEDKSGVVGLLAD